MPMNRVLPEEVHQEFRSDLINILQKYTGELPAQAMLAIAAHVTGAILALQDSDAMTSDQAINLVMKNIEQGNAETIAATEGSTKQ